MFFAAVIMDLFSEGSSAHWSEGVNLTNDSVWQEKMYWATISRKKLMLFLYSIEARDVFEPVATSHQGYCTLRHFGVGFTSDSVRQSPSFQSLRDGCSPCIEWCMCLCMSIILHMYKQTRSNRLWIPKETTFSIRKLFGNLKNMHRYQ